MATNIVEQLMQRPVHQLKPLHGFRMDHPHNGSGQQPAKLLSVYQFGLPVF